MASASDLANFVIEQFDARSSTTIERVVAAAIVELEALGESDAAAEAERRIPAVLLHLQARDPRELPFEFSQFASNRLIGKQRSRSAEGDRAARVRGHLGLEGALLEAILGLGNRTFELICAATMRLAGASEAYATDPGDEGGIDVFGRIPIRTASSDIAMTALTTSIIDRPLFFVGQSKCLAPDGEVQRGTVTQFHADVIALLSKYEGVPRPPSHRVPDTYYRQNETTLKLFFTTARYSPGATGFASAMDISLISGWQLAQFLLYHGIAIVDNGVEPAVDAEVLAAWASHVA